MSEPPAWAFERVEVVAADPGWAAAGAELAARVAAALAPWLVGSVEHVGSTAVPGLAAKPVLDLQAAVAEREAAAAALVGAGWHLVPAELDRRAWRRFLVRVERGRRVAHLHLILPGEPRGDEQVRFRDALRADPALRDAYAELKTGLAERFPDDREAYSAGKADFVRAALRRTGRRGGEDHPAAGGTGR